jgi:putative methionine-R-sulfoxide reductase with GAF domain
VSALEVPLESIRPAFQGIIPTPIATVSADGVPNSTYVSIVWYVDEERIALSNQYLGKTAENLRANRFVALRLVDPTTLAEYDVDATHLRSERSGETFEAIRTQLEAVAAQSGMEDVFHLRGIEILRVDRCAPTRGPVVGTPAAAHPAVLLSGLDVFVRRLSECRDLAEATRVGLRALDDVFGFRHSLLLVADDAEQQLFVVASNGYEESGVGAEVPITHGVIGVAAQRRRQVRLGNLDRLALAGSTDTGRLTEHHIPLPGLDDARSVLATPLLLHDRLIGVLYLDSSEPGRFDAQAGLLVEVLAGHLAITVALFESGGVEPLGPPRPAVPTPRSASAAVTFYERDGTVLVDGDYVIKGVPGRILYALLDEHERSGRTEFTNREIRLDRSIGLPAGNDNLEARLLTLRRRLAEHADPFRLERIGRGRLQLTVDAPIELVRHGTDSL